LSSSNVTVHLRDRTSRKIQISPSSLGSILSMMAAYCDEALSFVPNIYMETCASPPIRRRVWYFPTSVPSHICEVMLRGSSRQQHHPGLQCCSSQRALCERPRASRHSIQRLVSSGQIALTPAILEGINSNNLRYEMYHDRRRRFGDWPNSRDTNRVKTQVLDVPASPSRLFGTARLCQECIH